MAAETLVIHIRSDGSRVVKRDLETVGAAAVRAEQGASLLRRALLGLGALEVSRRVLQAADAFTVLQNRIRVVTDTTSQLNVVTRELFELSNRTRTSVTGNAEVFSRLALSAQELNLTYGQLLQVTESLHQAVVISGAGAQEARAGLIQLSQGIASGTLRGDELRSVLEQLPVVADVIAERLGVTRGELRLLGQQGKITAEDIIGAFLDAREELAERFARTVPTVAQAVQVLRNQMVQLIGTFTTNSGFARALARSILAVSDALKTLTTDAHAMQGVLTTIALILLPKVAAGLAAIVTFAAANPLLVLSAGAAVLVGRLVALRDEIVVSKDGVTTLGDVGRAVLEEMASLFGIVSEAAKEALTIIVETWNGVFGEDLPSNLQGFVTLFARGFDAIVGVVSGVGAVIAVAFSRPLETAGFLIVEAVNFVIRSLNVLSRAVSNQTRSIVAELASIAANLLGADSALARKLSDLGGLAIPEIGELENRFAETGETLGEAFSAGFSKATQGEDFVNRVFARAEEIGTERRQKTGETIALEAERAKVLQEVAGAQEAVNLSVGESVAQFLLGAEAGAEFAKSMRNAEISLKELGETLAGAVLNAIDQLSGAIADLALSGFRDFESFKEALSNIFRDLAREIIKLTIKFLILKAISAAFGSSAGGGGTSAAIGSAVGEVGSSVATSELRERQAGGPLGAFQPSIVGERGPELFVPRVGGNVVPTSRIETAPTVNVSVINVSDPNEVQAQLATRGGEEAVLNVITKNPRRVAQILRQTGG